MPGQHNSFQRNVTAVASRWQQCVRFEQPKVWNLKPPALKTKALPFDQQASIPIVRFYAYSQIKASSPLDPASQRNKTIRSLGFL